MKTKLSVILCLVTIIAGALIGYFAKFSEAQMVGFAVAMFGAGLLCSELWKNRDKSAKTPLVIFALVLIGLGSFLAGLLGIMSEEKLKAVIGLVFAFILLIAGIITNYIANKPTATKKLN